MQISGMENLSPHKKFEGPAMIKPTLRPFYRFKWPSDLPSECPMCGTKFHTGLNLRTDTNLYGRILRKAWILSIPPCTLMAFIWGYWLPETFNQIETIGNGLTDLISLFLFFVPAILCFLSLLSPSTRHVTCLKCDWKREFPGLKVRLGMKKKSI
jgi:hypothetical protein